MPLPVRRTRRTAVALVALAIAPLTAVAAVAAARDSDAPPDAVVQARADGPRNAAAEAATGDTDAMLGVVQRVVDCLRADGFAPGDPQVQGANVVIADWDPAWESPAGRATEECSFPAR